MKYSRSNKIDFRVKKFKRRLVEKKQGQLLMENIICDNNRASKNKKKFSAKNLEDVHFGIIGLVLAMILSNFNGLILAPIQYKKIINNKAKGIWNL